MKNLLKLLAIVLLLSSGSGDLYACPEGTDWISTSVLSTLLSGNPLLEVTSESSELKVRSNGRINLSATATLQSNAGGGVTMTGEADLKATGRYALTTSGNKRFIKITNISADQFTTKLYINGELATQQDYHDLVFAADRTIQYKCLRSGGMQLIQSVSGERRVLEFSRN